MKRDLDIENMNAVTLKNELQLARLRIQELEATINRMTLERTLSKPSGPLDIPRGLQSLQALNELISTSVKQFEESAGIPKPLLEHARKVREERLKKLNQTPVLSDPDFVPPAIGE